MKFTRLKLSGFKSFAEPAEVLIEPGLTGIVGPNGCGKSNLSDALRFVMGESSYKAMRGAEMDDVIFAGSGRRPPRNHAEVVLVIDNSDRTAPAALGDDEVLEVVRRIEREAGSIYRVNGREARARDVQLLFADASTGAHSPAIVGQGRIGELIAAKPQARRALLEEAAGVAGLHGRRHEAELRLNAAEENLARISDLIAEIEAQVEALRRQARQAIRYRNLSAEIRKAEAAVLHLRFVAAATAVREGETTLAEATRLAGERADAQAGAARDQAVAAAALPALRESDAAAAAVLQRLVLEGQALDGEERRTRERLAELERAIAQLKADSQREEAMARENGAVVGRLDAEAETIARAEAEAEERRAATAEARDRAAAALAETEAEGARATSALAEHNARRNALTSARNEADGRRRRLAAEQAGVEAELAALAARAPAVPPDTTRAAIEAADTALREAMAAAATAERDLAHRREEDTAARRAAETADRALHRVETEAKTLAGMMPREVPGKVPPLIAAVAAEPGSEAALAAAFGEELDVAPDPAAPRHWQAIDTPADDPQLPAGATPLSAEVIAPRELARRLAQTGIVSREAGPALSQSLKPGQALVSREGDLWRWDGLVAHAGAPSPAAARLAARNRLADLTAEAETLQSELKARQEALAAASNAVAAAVAADRAARAAWVAAQTRLGEARSAHDAAEREAARHASRAAALTEAVSRVSAGLADADGALAAAQASLAEIGDSAALDAAANAVRTRLAADRAAAAEARAAHDAEVRESDIRRRRLATIAEEKRGWETRIANAHAQVAALGERQAAASAEQGSLVERPGEIAARRVRLIGEVTKAEAARSQANQALTAGEDTLAAADRAAREAFSALAEAREAKGRAEERLAAAGERLTEIRQRLIETLNCRPEEAATLAGLAPGDPLPDIAEIDQRLERLKADRERLGAVNLRAEEEAAEAGARRDTLTGERDDLVGAIEKLRGAIAALNREGRERLLAAFNTVNGHFQSLFTHLFGGGAAELIWAEGTDPLGAGIEIIARPPGKRPETLTLLSGGEQALTALSLIFAVFLTNPAPICVLDEVDAPLDDANVDRFCTLLEEMTRRTDTRFMVVTHNPITMARMDRLFGVTMAERGVSQLVSVDLATAERFREAG
ncbi:MAG: chromosome segregation protein SMC [Bauldia sp.]